MITILTVWGDILLWFWLTFTWWLVVLSTFSCAYCLLWKNVYSGFLPIFKMSCLFFYGIHCYFSSFVSDFIRAFSLFFLVSLANSLLIYLFKEPALRFFDVFYCFLVSISFISVLIFIISFLLLNLGFICSLFSSSFRGKFILFEILFHFLREVCIAIKLPS